MQTKWKNVVNLVVGSVMALAMVGTVRAQSVTLYDNLPDNPETLTGDLNRAFANQIVQTGGAVPPGIVSTSIVLEDVNFGTFGGANLFTLTDFSFFVTNQSASAVEVQWHVRFFAADSYRDDNFNGVRDPGEFGNFPGRFIAGYDADTFLTLPGTDGTNPAFSLTPVTVTHDPTESLTLNRGVVWAGIYFTSEVARFADEATAISQLNEVGLLVSPNAFATRGPVGDFSADQAIGDTLGLFGPSDPGHYPYVSGIDPFNVDRFGGDGIPDATSNGYELFELASGLDTNFALSFGGTAVITPEPGTLALSALGMGLIVFAKRKRR